MKVCHQGLGTTTHIPSSRTPSWTLFSRLVLCIVSEWLWGRFGDPFGIRFGSIPLPVGALISLSPYKWMQGTGRSDPGVRSGLRECLGLALSTLGVICGHFMRFVNDFLWLASLVLDPFRLPFSTPPGHLRHRPLPLRGFSKFLHALKKPYTSQN